VYRTSNLVGVFFLLSLQEFRELCRILLFITLKMALHSFVFSDMIIFGSKGSNMTFYGRRFIKKAR
jgi:hypothetical protein